jgi:hypothetical protein
MGELLESGMLFVRFTRAVRLFRAFGPPTAGLYRTCVDRVLSLGSLFGARQNQNHDRPRRIINNLRHDDDDRYRYDTGARGQVWGLARPGWAPELSLELWWGMCEI